MDRRMSACCLAITCAVGVVPFVTVSGDATGQAQSSSGAPQTRPSNAGPDEPAWHYEGAGGPASWGKLSPKFSACAGGRAQSPIDIANPKPGAAAAVKTTFAPAALRIVHHEHRADSINNGHTIQVNYSGGDTLSVGGADYQLAQYHFHAPGEHTVDGKHFPMEMHMVHKAAAGKLAVVGVMIESGQHNAAFDPVWSNLPKVKGAESHLPSVKVDVDALLPKARTTYRYDGSLTTPPCSEGVAWLVMTTPIQLSSAQIGQFTALIKGNNRPVQALNGRPVVTDAVR